MLARILTLIVALLMAAPALAQDAASNLAVVVVSTGYGAADTSIVLTTGHGARLPTAPYNCAWFNATSYPGGINSSGTLDPNYEVVRVTARSTDTLTVTRAQEGTSASTKNAGGATYVMQCGLTAQRFTDINNGVFLRATIDTDTFCVDPTNNRVGIGTCSPAASLDLQADGAAFTTFATSYGTAQSVYRYRRARNTLAAPRRVQTNDVLGNMQFWGAQAADDSTDATFGGTSAVMRVDALESFTSAGRGSRFVFQTTPVGSASTGVNHFTIDAAAVTIQGGPHLTLGAATRIDVASNFAMYGADNLYFYPRQATRPWARMQFGTTNVAAGGPDPYGNLWGGTEQNQSHLYINGQIDTSGGTPSNYFGANVDFLVSDASGNIASGGSILNEGNWTNAGGFTLNRLALWNYNLGSIGKTVWFTQSGSTIPAFERQVFIVGGDSPSGNDGFALRVYGFDVTNDDAPDDAAVGIEARNYFRSNTTTTRTWNVGELFATLNFGGSNTNKTVNLLKVDTTNTATTGATVNLANLNYGGTNKFLVTSDGNTSIAGAFTLSGDNQPAQIAAATNDYAISSTSAVTVVDADQIRAITGMTGGADGRQHTLINDGASDSVLILRAQDTGSTAANRFAMTQDVVLEPSHAATFWYNSTASRWQLLSATSEDHSQRRYLPFDETDWLGLIGADTLEAHLPWNLALIGTGSAQSKIAGDGTHRGVLRCASGTTANSGCQTTTDLTAFRLSGGEFAEFVVNIDTTTNTTIRLGFLDTTTSTDATDGAYIEIPASTSPTCKTANNSTRTTSAAITTISTATWYRFLIEVDNTAGNVTCTIFDANGNSLGSQTNSTNIPTGSGRETGHGWVATNSGTVATNAMQVDYQAVGTHRAIVR